MTPYVTRHLTSATNNCSICVCILQQKYESLYINSIFVSVGVFNIYMCKDTGKTINDFESFSDLRQPIKLCGIKIFFNDVASRKNWKGDISTYSCIFLNKENDAVYK